MIDGSHRWPDQTGLNFWDVDLAGMEEMFNSGGREVRKVPVFLPKRHVSFHHCRTIHGSGPNRTDRPRRAIAIHMQNASNHWHEHYWSSGERAHHPNDRLVRWVDGIPDYTDPRICAELG